MSNKLTLTNIENIIDGHFEVERNFVFVCDETLSDFIMDYLDEDYGLKDGDCGNLPNITDEYYVSVMFYEDEEPKVFCENARTMDGRYKYSGVDNCDYFIMDDTGVCEITANKILNGEGCTWSWFEIVDEDEDDYCGEYGEYKCCDCEDCCDCEEVDDSEEEEIRIIAEAIQDIYDVYPCPECVSDVLIKLASRFKDVGWCNHRDYIRAVNEDEE